MDDNVDRLARWVRTLGLSGPAAFFLELYRPLAFLGQQGFYFLEPYLKMLPPGVARAVSILGDDRKIEELSFLLRQCQSKYVWPSLFKLPAAPSEGEEA